MKKKRLIHALLALLCTIALCNAPVYAAQSRASEYIDTSSVTLTRKSNGDLSIFFTVRATGKMDVIGASSVEVQRNTITGWVTEYTFTPDNAPEIQAEGKPQHNATLTYSPLFTGKEYRAVVMIYVKDKTGEGTQQLISKTV